jgi:PAS domain S-box-containing protein
VSAAVNPQTLHLGPDIDTADPTRNALLCAAEAVASAGADNIFAVLVLGAARALNVDMAFIGVQTDERRDVVRAIAVCDRGQVQPNFEYGLPGTPCESVMGQEFRYYAAGIQELFPHPLVKEVGSIGYAAIPLFDACGHSMGMMAVIDRKPLRDRALTESVLKIFSVRAAIELERRTTDEARRRSEESYRSIFEAAEDALFIRDADTGAILDVNPKACEQYGYSREELLAADVGQLSSGVPPYTSERATQLVAQARRGGPVRTEWHSRNKDGSLHWDEKYIKRVKIGGADRILVVTREITERKRAEEERVRLEGQLRQAQKMEAIGQLTGGIAHDFNNILTGTLGYLVMARERAAGFGDAKLIKYLERAEGSGERAKALIQEMLTFSRGQRGAPRSLQLGPEIAEAVKLLRSSLPSSVETQIELASNVPCVLLDPLHVEQVLMNLCINARDAMEGKGSLRLALRTADGAGCECSSCHQTVTGSYVELAVTDSGPGIPAPVRERMFEPFFSTKEVGKGSGMGLAMVHGIVHEYGGHIQVETSPGAGTTIRIWFPAWFPPRTMSDGLGEAGRGDSSVGQVCRRLHGRLLLAEDEAAVREFMEDLLTSWGLEVALAENGEEACGRFAAEPDAFDLVVLDQTMPRLRGLEAAEQLLKLRPDMPVVLYSGHSEHLSEASIAAVGIRALARKPLDIPAFRRLLEGLLPS